MAVTYRTYSVYGLSVRADLPLPTLPCSSAIPDLEVRWGRVDWPSAPAHLFSGVRFHYSGSQATIDVPDLGRFQITGGSRILIDPDDAAQEEALGHYVLGPAFAIALQQRDRLLLHASAVSFDGKVFAFLGQKGGGKSTTAVLLGTHGASLITDDMLAVEFDTNERAFTILGVPFVRLTDDAARVCSHALGEVSGGLGYKRRYLINHSLCGHRLPLAAVYVLADGCECSADELPVGAAMTELLKHSYLAGILPAMNRTQEHFRQCSLLLKCVPIARLRFPRNIASLADVARLLKASSEAPLAIRED